MAEIEPRRPSPDALLKRVEAEERYHTRGKLKVFLGYASGVGKSFRMLDEGRRRKARKQDVVVAAVQPEASLEVNDLIKNLEVIPPRTDLGSPSLDVEAVRRRRPSICLIDGLAYKNPPGSKNTERWQDVEELLAAGISVITTINLQYIREKQDEIEAIRGRKVQDSVPESFLRQADEIEIVDAPPEYCVTLDSSEDDAQRLQQQLSELRQIALVFTAEVVDQQLADYLHRQGLDQTYGTHERILVCITPRSNASLMISRGKRQAERFHGELFVTYAEQGEFTARDGETLNRNLEAARDAQAHVEILTGEDPVAAIIHFAEQQGVTQIFVGHSQRTGWMQYLQPNLVERLIMETDGIDVRIFPQDTHSGLS